MGFWDYLIVATWFRAKLGVRETLSGVGATPQLLFYGGQTMKAFALVGLAVVVITFGTFVRSAGAQIIGGTPDIAALQAAVSAIQGQVATLQGQVATLKAQNATLTTRMHTLEHLNGDLPALAPFVSVNPGPINGVGGPHVIFTGVNVHIRSGSGMTNDTTNLGNLIIGYNEPRNTTDTTNRTGSHTVIIGPEHQFTASGGFLAGFQNTVSADFASVSGGKFNMASGDFASVSGGRENTASGSSASVSGGGANTASGPNASVSGGGGNTASRFAASVSGGEGNTASGSFASVSGGNTRTAPDTDDWAAGSLFEDN